MIRQFSAGGVVYKKNNGEILFLLRKNTSNSGYYASNEWSLPKGWLDDAPDGINPGPLTLGQKRATEDQIRNTALKEVAEEGGVSARIISRLGTTKFFFVDHNKQKVWKTVIFYLMEYQSDLPGGPGWESSGVSWKNADQAREMLKKRKGEAQLISKAEKLVISGQQGLI
jgi:ADP-ribose pyrophosphatase YjhB (NUDIX family)